MKTILFSFIFCLMHVCLSAQAGTLDSSFGKDGFIAGQMPGLVNSILQQQDGKLLAAGSFFDLNGIIARYLPDGTLDSSFGNNGAALSNPPGGANDMVLLPDGKILICGGYVDSTSPFENEFVARFQANGKPDSSFGINGTSIIPKFHNWDAYTDIALTGSGDIIAGGLGYNNPNTLDSEYSIISRITSNGTFDYSFGNNGYVINLLAIGLNDLAIQADGKIVTAGYSFSKDYVLSRYNTDGTLDHSFGTNGNVVTAGKGNDVPEKIIIEPDGKLILGGYSDGNKYYMAALRYNNDGSLDKSFGHAGEVFVDFGDSAGIAYDMLQQPDGKLILTGAVVDLQHTGRNFGLCRITNDGKLDSSFGIGGLQITQYPGGGEAYCATLQADNKIVLGGYYQGNEGQSYLMVRYNNDLSKRQILISKIKHYISTHNNADATTLNKNISLYPNPVQNILTIKGLNAINNYQLIINNSKGSVVATKQVSNASSYQFNVQNLSSGVYYVNVVSDNKVITTLKFVKQ